MKIRNLVMSFAIAILILGKINAQDFTNYNLYLQNPVLYNPAHALDTTKLRAFVNSHLQWAGFDGAPRVNTFGIYGAFVKNMAFGLSAFNRQQGITTNTNISLSYAYRVHVSEKHYFTLGISNGILIDKLKTSKIEYADLSDPTIGSTAYNLNSYFAQAGLVYYYRGFEAQVVLPQLYERQKVNFYALGILSYEYALNTLWDVKPSFMYRTKSTTPSQMEADLTLTYNKRVSGQVGYRSNQSFIFGVGANLGRFYIGYAWQHEKGIISSATKGTNEIQLIYHFGSSQNVVKKDNSLISEAEQKMEADTVKKEDPTKKLEEQLAKLQEEQKKLADATYAEQKKIEDQMNEILKKLDELNKNQPQNNNQNPQNFDNVKKGETYNLGYVTFETGKNTLKKEGIDIMDKLADAMKKNPSLNVQIIGYTDNTGSDATNNELSIKRAQSCKQYLESKGIAASRMKALGGGSSNPIASNDTWENKAKNRRVEFKFE